MVTNIPGNIGIAVIYWEMSNSIVLTGKLLKKRLETGSGVNANGSLNTCQVPLLSAVT